MKCRHCQHDLSLDFLDLASAPPSNAYLSASQLFEAEVWLPLKIKVCSNCWLVQTLDFTGRENLFDENYAYFSSYSSSWLAHAQSYVRAAISRFALNAQSLVIEVAANDGYLLQYLQAAGIPNLGIEPTHSTAEAARAKGITVIEAFFGQQCASQLAQQGQTADLMIANNVLAHVPDINDFISGFTRLLKPAGVASFEFPHLLNMVRENQFDTAYHEHFSYLSLTAVQRIFSACGLTVFDVETLNTHGGSLRVWAQRSDTLSQPRTAAVDKLLAQEAAAGINSAAFYQQAQQRALQTKFNLLEFLLQARAAGKQVAAYGAAAKGNTLLNFCGIKADLIAAVIDLNPHKQGKYLPGSRIPIFGLDYLQTTRPDILLILPWNLTQEITSLLQDKLAKSASALELWVAIPELKQVARLT